jgi:hypothetical protein
MPIPVDQAELAGFIGEGVLYGKQGCPKAACLTSFSITVNTSPRRFGMRVSERQLVLAATRAENQQETYYGCKTPTPWSDRCIPPADDRRKSLKTMIPRLEVSECMTSTGQLTPRASGVVLSLPRAVAKVPLALSLFSRRHGRADLWLERSSLVWNLPF